jgi:hypothetical protein
MPAEDFSQKDADAVIALAQQAPLQNMKHAEAVSDLLGRFVKFYEKATKPAPVARAPRKQAEKATTEPDVLA